MNRETSLMYGVASLIKMHIKLVTERDLCLQIVEKLTEILDRLILSEKHANADINIQLVYDFDDNNTIQQEVYEVYHSKWYV